LLVHSGHPHNLKLSQTRFQIAFSPTSNFGRENSNDFNKALQSERGCKEATARETKFESKRDKEEEEEEETGDYIFACKFYLLHYQFLKLLEVYEYSLLCFQSWHLLHFCNFSEISALLF
jgi:hypothetical protein